MKILFRNTSLALLCIFTIIVLNKAAAVPHEKTGKNNRHFLFSVKPSLVVDTCCLLNVLSNEEPYASYYKSEREEWLTKLISSDALKQNLQIWQGHGIPLAYLMNGSATMLAAFQDDPIRWEQQAKSNLNEPAYKAELEFTLAHRKELSSILAAIRKSQFNSWWKQHAYQQLRKKSETIELELNERFNNSALKTLNRFVQCSSRTQYKENSLPPLYVASFSKPYNFNLANRQACFRSDIDEEDSPCVLLHEWLHSFNPNPAVQSKHSEMPNESSFYADAWKRIYVQGKEGEEEEFVVAAELYTAVNSSIISKKSALRRIKNNYGGIPLAGLIYARLMDDYPNGLPEDFDYNKYLQSLLSAQKLAGNNLQQEFDNIIAPVKGLAGMKLSRLDACITVRKVFDGTPAAQAGIQQGDIVKSVNSVIVPQSVDRTIDMISGPPGASFKLAIERKKQNLELSLTLR